MEEVAKSSEFLMENQSREQKRPEIRKKEKERQSKRKDNVISRIWGTCRVEKPSCLNAGDPPCHLSQDLITDLSNLFSFKGLKKEKQNELSKFVENGGVNVIANALSNMLKYNLLEKDSMEKDSTESNSTEKNSKDKVVPWDEYMISAFNSGKKSSIQNYYDVCNYIEGQNELIVHLQRKLALMDNFCLNEANKSSEQCAKEKKEIDVVDPCANVDSQV